MWAIMPCPGNGLKAARSDRISYCTAIGSGAIEEGGMTAFAFTLFALRAGKLLLAVFGILGVGALIAAAISDRTPENYRMPAIIGAAAAVIGLIVLALATFGMGRLP
jgi:hypothetical protein